MRDDWYDRRQHAEALHASLSRLLREADYVDGAALHLDMSDLARDALSSSARDIRDEVASLVERLEDELWPAAWGFSEADLDIGRPVTRADLDRLFGR